MSHLPLHDDKNFRSRCKLPGCSFFSHLFCEICKVHLCLTSKRNCYYDYHSNSRLKGNNNTRQKKTTKDSRRRFPIETANEKCSGRRRTSVVVNEPKKEFHQTKQMKAVNHGQKKRPGRVKDQCCENTSAEKERSYRRVTECSVSVSPKSQQDNQIKINNGQTTPGYNTRSKMCGKPARELIFAESSVSNKKIFMTMIGLVSTKKN